MFRNIDFFQIKSFQIAALCALFLASWAPSVRALTITGFQDGNNYQFIFSGAVDTTGATQFGLRSGSALLDPSTDQIFLGAPGSQIRSDLYLLVGAFTSFGTGFTSLPSSSTGDRVGLRILNGNPIVALPENYVSGAAISGSSTFTNRNTTFLGITPGTYLYDLPNDTITLQILDTAQPAAVPLPAGVWLFGTALAGLGFVHRRARHKSF
ncbi:MAG: VPLPA-CTERM sorting domain-containing protein [Pseudomonadota bacterium]